MADADLTELRLVSLAAKALDDVADRYWTERDALVLTLTERGVRALDIQVAADIGPSRLAQILHRERRRASLKT